ncbi:SWIM zinc finger domain-containing protein [Bacillus sp. 03113]|uniref:SWIM zinc finger family protein n=1 Tax=Bacillus sp. 03113 TaxID=2578211 RepID=UPI00215C947F|nr:SWIM zinc finger family protein [Bacillus sp. 03113]
MIVIPERYWESLEFVSNSLKEHLQPDQTKDASLVQKGLLLYQQGLVSQVKFGDDLVTATVQDVTPVKVSLDLNFINMSECTCPAEGFCRHMLAVFFYLLSSQRGSVASWLEGFREPQKEKQAARALGIQKAKDLLKTSGRLQHSYEAWTDDFNQSFDKIMTGHGEPKPHLIPELFRIYGRKIKANEPLKKEWKLLYLLIASIFSFQKLAELSIQCRHEEKTINHYYRHLFQGLADDISDILDRLTVHSLPFAFDQFIDQLKKDSTHLLLLDSKIGFECIEVYRILWTQLFNRNEWREEELKKLEMLSEKSLSVQIGKTHLHFLLQEDRAALKLIQTTDENMAAFLLYWLNQLSSHKDWKRMELYIQVFIQSLKGFLAKQQHYDSSLDFTNLALKTIAPYCHERKRLDLFEKALVQTLPYSYGEYEYFLFNQGIFDKWLELQTYIGLDMEMLPNDRIKHLQNEDPEILLPLYHQSIQEHINMKNREHYRTAVKEMKKLRTLYKKLKRQTDWDQYIKTLIDRTKRLRAFHEECKRGKIIKEE